MRVDEYQREALKSDTSRGKATARFLLLGLFGEAGGVLTAVKKKERDQESSRRYIAQVTEELGDLLWYISAVTSRNGARLSDLVKPFSHHGAKLSAHITFADLQRRRATVSTLPSLSLEFALVSLASAVGQLVQVQTESLKQRSSVDTAEAFTRVLRRLVIVANKAGIDLTDVAKSNLAKIRDRWPDKKTYPNRFDVEYPDYERLPDEMTIDIREITRDDGQYFVLQSCDGIHVGDRLTDNIEDPDEYRFHDVFHYAYAAILGWSPVLRALLRLKRKSNKIVDETQDGARAILVEEGIAALIFNEAKQQAFFKDIDNGKLSFDLLKKVKGFVNGYEVAEAPLWVWEEAILQGFEAFRFLQDHRAARITISYPSRKLLVRAIP